MITFAPSSSSRCAQDFAMSGLFPCVSQVLSSSFRFSTPPFAFHCPTRIFAAASAGLSNGAIVPVLSNAHPMTIGPFAPALPLLVVAATAVPIAASAATPTTTATHLPRPLMLLLPVVIPRLESTSRYPVNGLADSRVPDPVERLPPAACQLGGRDVPERVRPRVAKSAVVAEDLEVVEAVPPCAIERAEDRRQIGEPVAGKDSVGPAPRRVAPVGHMDADEPADLALDVVRQRVGVPQMPGVELDPECGAPDGLEQLDRLGDRGDHRPVLSADAVHRLETDSNAGQHGLLADRPKPLEDDVPRPIGVAVSGGPGQADDTTGTERSQPVQGRTDGLHALLRLAG